jgi:NAD(P)H-hydrate epimerase
MDTNSGYISDRIIRADSTLMLVLPKEELVKKGSSKYVGDLYLADISVPPLLYCQLGLKVPPLINKDTINEYE